MSKILQFCTFYLDSHFFGINVTYVQEIIRFQEMTEIPLAPSSVRGLINLRGQIVTAIDLRHRLKFQPLPSDRRPTNVIINADGAPISLLVDEIGDVLEVSSELFESPPQTLDMETRQLVKGAYKLENQLLLALDTLKTIDLN